MMTKMIMMTIANDGDDNEGWRPIPSSLDGDYEDKDDDDDNKALMMMTKMTIANDDDDNDDNDDDNEGWEADPLLL